MLKNDRWISEQAALGMLEPFQEKLIRHLQPESEKSPVLSFGCSSYGYDLRLSSKEFLIFMINNRPSSTDIILTGPSIPPKVIEMADQITELRCN